MRRDLTAWLPVFLLVVLGGLASIGDVLQSMPGKGAAATSNELVVTSRSDRGPGSLREALFHTMKADGAITIRLDVDLVEVALPLPPIAINDLLIVGRADEQTRIRRTGGAGDVPLFTINADGVELRNFAVDGGDGIAIQVSATRFTAAALQVENSRVGVEAIDAAGLAIRDSRFSDNAIALRLGGNAAHALVKNSEFLNNADSSIWIVFSDGQGNVRIFDNRISGGRDGVVAANAVVDIRGNEINRFARSGLALSDAVATVSGNRLMDSRGIGISASRLRNSVIVDNEIARNEQVGILIVDAGGLQVDGNRLYSNGYGIAAVGLERISASLRNNTLVDQSIDGLVAIGESPVIAGNHAVRNRQAGIRILDLVLPDRPVIEAIPQLANNVLTDNGYDDVVYGEYVVDEP